MSQAQAPSEVQPLLVGAAEAARLLGISERHFYKLHSSGRVPKPVRFGRAVRWQVAELHAWLGAGAPARARWEAMQRNRMHATTG
jgi:excisionase family DNA binding protein